MAFEFACCSSCWTLATSFSSVEPEPGSLDFEVEGEPVGAGLLASEAFLPDFVDPFDRRESALVAGSGRLSVLDGCDAGDGDLEPEDDDDWSRPLEELSFRDAGRIESESTVPNGEFPGSEAP